MTNDILKIRLQELILSNERLRAQTCDKQMSQFGPGEPCDSMESRVKDSQNAKETELLHSRLRDIAQAIINDDQVFADDKINPGSPRSRSPVRRVNSRPSSRNGSPFADATYSAVQAALNKRQLQVSKF